MQFLRAAAAAVAGEAVGGATEPGMLRHRERVSARLERSEEAPQRGPVVVDMFDDTESDGHVEFLDIG